MGAIEQEILDKIAHLDEIQKARVLEFIETMGSRPTTVSQRSYSALELMKLPFEERNRLAIEALERSQNDDVELLDAYDEADFDDE